MSVRDDLLPGLSTKDFIWLFVGTLGLVFVAVVTFAILSDGRLLHTRELSSSALYVLQDYVYAALIVSGVYIFGIRKAGLTLSDMGFRRCSAKWIAGAFAAGISLFIIRIVADRAIIAVTGMQRFLEPGRTDRAITDGSSGWLTAAFAVAVIIITPVVTETFQRGILFAWMRRNFSFLFSVIPSGIIFGVLHIEVVRYPPNLIFGLCTAYLYEKSGSLWPPIAFHMAVGATYVVHLMMW